jgi:hypothetical protein
MRVSNLFDPISTYGARNGRRAACGTAEKKASVKRKMNRPAANLGVHDRLSDPRGSTKGVPDSGYAIMVYGGTGAGFPALSVESRPTFRPID